VVPIPIEYEGVRGEVILEPFILPHKDDFNSIDAFNHASGPNNWNQQQGFYIYRAGRMIQSGGWSNLRAPDEHLKLVRVAVSFSPTLDEAFKINVAKMRVQLPAQIRDNIREAISPAIKLGQEIYRKSAHPSSTQTEKPQDSPRKPAPGGASSTRESEGEKSESLLTLQQWTERTLAVA